MQPTFYNPLQHLDNLESDIQRSIDAKFDFVGFVLLAIGIEYLGLLWDADAPEKGGMSEARFTKAIKDLFKGKGWYGHNHSLLYREFRGALIHQYRVGKGILLTSNCVSGAPLSDHLKKTSGGDYIFVLEELFADFKEAKKRLLTKLTKGPDGLNGKKSTEYLALLAVNVDNALATYCPSGQTSYPHVTISGNSSNKVVSTKNKKHQGKYRG